MCPGWTFAHESFTGGKAKNQSNSSDAVKTSGATASDAARLQQHHLAALGGLSDACAAVCLQVATGSAAAMPGDIARTSFLKCSDPDQTVEAGMSDEYTSQPTTKIELQPSQALHISTRMRSGHNKTALTLLRTSAGVAICELGEHYCQMTGA